MTSLAFGVPVPKAAVNEDHLAPPYKDKVWTAWKRAPMQPKPVAKPMRKRAHDHFWLCVLALDRAHHA